MLWHKMSQLGAKNNILWTKYHTICLCVTLACTTRIAYIVLRTVVRYSYIVETVVWNSHGEHDDHGYSKHVNFEILGRRIIWGLRSDYRLKIINRASHLFRRFCYKMYGFTTKHSVTDRRTDRQTDNSGLIGSRILAFDSITYICHSLRACSGTGSHARLYVEAHCTPLRRRDASHVSKDGKLGWSLDDCIDNRFVYIATVTEWPTCH